MLGLRIAVIAPLLVVLAACGGGGGGGGDGGGRNGLTFTLDRSSIAFDYEQAPFPPPPQTVTATATGNYSGTLYVGAVVEGTAINPLVQATISGMQGTFSITPRTDLEAGEYSGRVLLLACSDAQCNNRIGNTPLPVAYTVRVRPTLKATPASVTLSATSGSPASMPVSLQLPSGASTATVSVNYGSDVFSVTDVTATGFLVTARSMPTGFYPGTLQISAGSRSINVSMSYQVAAPPGGDRNLEASPSSFTLNATEGATSTPATLNVMPASWDSSHGTRIRYGGTASDWLSATPISGGYSVVANAAGLAAGFYSASLFVVGRPPVAEVQIPVSLTVGLGLIKPADVLVPVNSETTASQLSGSVPITLASGPAVNWSATSDQSWLVLTRAAGATGTDLTYEIDAARLSALTNGAEHVAHITINPELPTMTTATFAVRVNKRLGEVTGLGPYLQVSDRPLRVIARGVGFDAIANPASRIVVEGIPGAMIQRRGDTELLITAPAPASGTYRVRVSNALGLSVASRAVSVVDPRVQVAANVATGGDGETVIYDAVHDAVYFANTGLSAVQRFAPSGGTWLQTSSVPVPALRDIGISNDGADLIALSTTGDVFSSSSILRMLETADSGLAERAQVQRTGGLGGGSFGVGLSVTNDGRVWFAPSSSGPDYDSLVYFDPLHQLFGRVTADFSTSFMGPQYVASGDGSRLLIVQNRCCTPTPPVLYMDAIDSTLRVNPAELENFTWAHSNTDGERVLLSLHSVYNRAFEFIGDTTALSSTQGANWFAVSGVITPDGNRVYLVVYNDTEIRQEPAPTPTLYPRVYVFDSSTRMVNTTQLPLLGYFTLDAYPTTRRSSGNYRPGSTISPDGRTLFVAGGVNLMVVPIPDEGTLTPP